ncbi:MAG TPA: hypothetical protein VMT35_02525, partial [Ignavibacteriaceae bacterium]|nr:hypothetical protein [Ignavibacteriaceae bacterium]
MKRKKNNGTKNQNRESVSGLNPDKGKKLFFYFTLLALPLVLIIILELALRLFSFGDDLRLFIPSSDPNYLKCNPIVGKRYFSQLDFTTPIFDPFLRDKPPNGFRIFILGESTVQGFPYDANIAFSRILQRRLQDVFPERSIEVINLGMTAITSYTLLDFTDEILEQKPDLILIYAGHNEYYGAMGVASMENGSIPGWLKKLHLRLVHLKIYQLLQGLIRDIYKFITPIGEN